MTSYAGLDVSQRETQICIIDAGGAVRWCGKVRSEPAALAVVLRRHAPDLERAVLESGALSGWLCGGLAEAGLPAPCIDARVAHVALKQRRSKTDRGDAEGLVRLAQTGWFKMVRLRSRASRERHGLLAARERLVRIQRDLLNQIRGLAKPLGLVLPRTTPGRQRGLTPKASPTSTARPRLQTARLRPWCVTCATRAACSPAPSVTPSKWRRR